MEHTAHGYWLAEAGAVEPAPALDSDLSADIVVIGGGYTGMWAAWEARRLEPGASVALLDADLCGSGPSGRNGGFCNLLWRSLPAMRERWGDSGALAMARAAAGAVDAIESFCVEGGVDAWFRRGGYLEVATDPSQDGAWDAAVDACRALGEPGAMIPQAPAQVAARCASPAFHGGAFVPAAATVQPARLALGLRERLRHDAAVELRERSPVRLLRASPTGVEAVAESGATVRAGTAIVAAGGAARARRGPLADCLTITSSHMVLTEPVPDVIERLGWTGGECVTDARRLLTYFRTTPDGRIAFGWGGGRIAAGARTGGRAELDRRVVAATAARLRAYFPELAGRRLTHAWGGPIDAAPTHLPLIRPLPGDRAFAAAGYTGNGVGPARMVGGVLASLALGRRDAATRLPIVDPAPRRVPPEPLSWLGGNAIRAAIGRVEDAAAAGRRPGPVSAAVARLPDLIGFRIGR